MTPEPLNTILIVLVMTVAVLFVAAGVHCSPSPSRSS
jgi:hypothetical protein